MCLVHVYIVVYTYMYVTCTMCTIFTVNMCFYVVSTQPSNLGNPVESVCFILGYGEEVDKSDIRCV